MSLPPNWDDFLDHLGREPKPCGTPAAYRRHLRHDEPACRPCLDAHNQATKQSQKRTKAAA